MYTPRLGVDIGGTFTDLALQLEDRVVSHKLLTTPGAPEQAIIQGIEQILRQSALSITDIGVIIHGTTLATNALIERSGAHTALITTRGFRDVIEMRTENRFEQYDLNLVLPRPLIERRHRYTVKQRISARGELLAELEPQELEALIERIRLAGYASVAVGLIHSYVDGRHERLIRRALLARLPALSVSLSCEVSPQMREYERFNTVCANAYVKPMMKRYLRRLRDRLAELGARCPVYIMHSGGGLMSIDNAGEFPVRLIESGPAGGAIFAADIAARHGIAKALSFDMGGTTAKICLIDRYTPKTARTFEVARTYRFKKGSGMPISVPVIEMVEIGAGGGSIARVDALRQIRVGPESAGSEPGPACYDRGGSHATVTDADLMLGRLDADDFGGGLVLKRDHAQQALQQLGAALTIDALQSAVGVVEVIDENMANAARMHAIENGEDLSEYTLIAFGGAAPLHAARLCEKLQLDRLVIPPGAGVGSAIGFLRASFSFEAVRSFYQRLSRVDLEQVGALLTALTDEAGQFVAHADSRAATVTECKAFMRYVGQGWEIPVNLEPPDLDSAENLQHAFERQYKNLFGRTVERLDVEATGWSVKVSTHRDAPPPLPPVGAPRRIAATVHRAAYDTRKRVSLDVPVVRRSALRSGDQMPGPVMVVEPETSVFVPADFALQCASDGSLLIQRQAADEAEPGAPAAMNNANPTPP